MLSCCGPWGILKAASSQDHNDADAILDAKLNEWLDKFVAIYPGISTTAILSIAGDVM